MPVKKTDAEAITPDEGAATGNVGNDALLHDLAATQDLVLKQEVMIQRLADQVEALSKTALSDLGPPPADPADFGPPLLAEGWRRYGARFSELTLMRVGLGHEMHGGVAVPVPVITGKPVDFTGGVFETNDEGAIEFLENHEDFNITFWRDDFAIRRHSRVEVTQGVKTSVSTPRAPLAAPMQP
jgi:hypothetical protein